MSLLNPKSKRQGYRVVGVSLPPRDHNYLTLYTLAKGDTKSKIIKKLLDQWIEENKKKQNEVELLKEITERVNTRWKAFGINDSLMSFEDFRAVIKDELLEKGISPTYVNLIISNIRNGKN